MAVKNVYVHSNFNKQELRNFSAEKRSTDPTGADLYEGRVWENTTDKRLKWYDGTDVKTLAQLEDLEVFGALVDTHSASSGIPSTGSGFNGEIRQGDYWIITTAGTIPNLSGKSTTLEVGDFLFAATDDAAAAVDFYGVQTNLNLPDGIGLVEEVTLAALPANVPTDIPTTFDNAYNIDVYDSNNEKIELKITGPITAPQAESNVALTNVKFRITGN